MSDLEEKEDRALGIVDRVVLFVALWLGGPIIGFMVLVTVSDVTMRYVFNSPFVGAEDYSSLSLTLVFAPVIAYSGRTGGQVAVELFVNLMSPRITRWTNLTVRLLSIAMLGVLTWQLVLAGQKASIFGEASFALLIPFEPSWKT